MGGLRGRTMGRGILNPGLDTQVRFEREVAQLAKRNTELEFALAIIDRMKDLPDAVHTIINTTKRKGGE